MSLNLATKSQTNFHYFQTHTKTNIPPITKLTTIIIIMNHFGNPLVTTMHSPSLLRESVKPRHRRQPNTTTNNSNSSSSTRITPSTSFDSSNHNDLLHLPSLQSPPLSTIHRRSVSDHQQLLHPDDPPPSINTHHHRQRSYTADAAALTSSSVTSCSSSYCTNHTPSSLRLPSQYALNTTTGFELSLQEELQDFDAMISLSHHSASTTESSSATSGGEDRTSYSSSSRRRSIPPHQRAIQNNSNSNSNSIMDNADYDDMMI